MDRRSFLKFSLLAGAFGASACRKQTQAPIVRYIPERPGSFPFLEVEGSYYDIGYQVGSFFERNIKSVIAERLEWVEGLRQKMSDEKGMEYQQALKTSLMETFPQYLDEIRGFADGAGVDFNTMWALSIKSELEAFNEPPGCSTVYYNDRQNNWLFHNEDGHDAWTGNMFILKAKPPSGVEFISFVYSGLIPGVGPGMNSNGVISSANFIGTTNPQVGIPRYFLGRAILEAKNFDHAIQLAGASPRAFPWHHNIASSETGEYASVETLPGGAVSVKKPVGTYIHTNHLIHGKTIDYPYENQKYKNSSSISRFEVLQEEKALHTGTIEDPKTILGWLSSRKNAPYSPCRVASKDNKGQTLGTAFFDIKNGIFRLYKGAPCESVEQGTFYEYRV